jgi:hypothetical protein
MSNPGLKLVISASIIALQSLAIWGLLVWVAILIFVETPTSLLSALFLIGLLIAAGLWSSNIVLGLWRKLRWAHTPAMVLQLLIASIGIASFAGEFGNLLIGAVLLVPATVVFVLLFSRSVREQFQR